MTTMDVEEQLQRMNLTSLDQLGVAMQSQPSQRENLREDQIENSEGGYVWAVNDLNRVRRFLILGTTGGSFYASEKTLTMENAKALIDIIEKGNGALILREIVEISLDGRAPNQNSTLFALALCARSRNHNF
uniref:TROVE domain-containing protein n=1 Tax=Plectus sambesii TaxID=2011161 RepID=A0A914VJE3_9BILA